MLEQGEQPRWYLVATKPRQELRAQEHLNNQSVECLLPLAKVEKTVRGKRVLKTEALFPGYIFVHFSETDPCFSKLRSTRGVRDFVRFSGKPAVVPDNLADQLKKEFSDQREERIISNLPQSGQQVIILEGPFRGLEAVFHTLDGEQRAILLLDILGKQQKLTIDLASMSIN